MWGNICLSPVAARFVRRAFVCGHGHEVRTPSPCEGRAVAVEIRAPARSPSCCLLPCPLCTLYLLFGFARLNAADVSSPSSSSLGGRGELPGLMRSRGG